MIFDKELDENLKVCPKCEHHFPIGSRERIHSLVETCTFEEMDAEMTSVDVLQVHRRGHLQVQARGNYKKTTVSRTPSSPASARSANTASRWA